MAKQAPFHKLSQLAELVNQQPESAVAPLEQLARDYPSDSQVLYALGVAYLNTGEVDQAITRLEAAAKREKQAVSEVYGALARAYSYAGMPAHAHRAGTKAGLQLPPWQETLNGNLPENAKLTDLIGFEESRRQLTQAGPHALAAIRQMQAFHRKFPDYLPASNIIATGLFLQGDFAAARAQVEQVLASDPQNIHALLNLARVERLLGGTQAVAALRPRAKAARLVDAENQPITGGELALANLYQLMNDAAASQAALERYLAEDPERESAEVIQLRERLARVQENPHAPLLLPSELLPPGWFQRWRNAPTSRMGKLIEADLRSVPGWFEQVTEGLPFESDGMATLLTATLINPDFDHVPWPDGLNATQRAARLVALLEEGRGSQAGILSVARTLQGFNRLPEETVIKDAQGNDLQMLHFELTDEPLDSMTSREDLRRYEQAQQQMRSGLFEQARMGFEALTKKYPDFPSIRFNLASSIAQLGGAENEALATEMLQALHQQYPHYLFPPAQLAMQAIQDGELERARELLTFPRGVKRLHVLEYGYFMAVQGVLALRRGELDQVERILSSLTQLLDKNSMPLRLLRQEILRQMRESRPAEQQELRALLALLE